MSHRALIGGTSREVTGAKTLVGGTGYDLAGGKTLIGGTGYNIEFFNGVVLYSAGSTFIQNGELGYYIASLDENDEWWYPSGFKTDDDTYSKFRSDCIRILHYMEPEDYYEGWYASARGMIRLSGLDSSQYSQIYVETNRQRIAFADSDKEAGYVDMLGSFSTGTWDGDKYIHGYRLSTDKYLFIWGQSETTDITKIWLE